MANLRPGDPLGSLITNASRVDALSSHLWGRVTSLGSGTCDVLLDGGTRPLERKRIVGGIPQINDRVEVRIEDGQYVVHVPSLSAPSANGAGLVILSGSTGGGGGGVSFPLPHASTHASGGSDPVSPASIGAATPGDITASMNAHLAAANPHPQYLLLAGGTMTGALHMTSADLTGTLSSSPFVSGATGWQITVAGDAEERNLHIRSSLYAQAFVFDLISTQAGTQLIAKNASALSTAMMVALGTASIQLVDLTDLQLVGGAALNMVGGWTITVKDSPGTNAQIFDNGDIINIKSEIAGAIYETWFNVTTYVPNGDGTQSYTCTYLYGAIGVTYGKETGVTDFGVTGQGILKATVIGANGPYYDVLTHTGTPWLSMTVQARLGNLTGITDDNYGVLSGYGLYSTNVWLKGAIRATSGVIGPFTIEATKLYMGEGTFRDATGATPFYVDHNGAVSFNDRLFWNPISSYLKVDADELAVRGNIHASGLHNADNSYITEVSFGQLKNFVIGSTQFSETGMQGSYIRSFGTNHTLYGGQLHFTTTNSGTVASTGGPGGMIFQSYTGSAYQQNAVMVGSTRRWGFGTVDPTLEWQWAPYTFRDNSVYPIWPGGEGNWGGRYLDGSVYYILPGGKVVSGCLVLGVLCNELPSNGFIMEFIGYGVTKTVTLGSNVITFAVNDTAGDGNVFLAVQRTTGASLWHAVVKTIWV